MILSIVISLTFARSFSQPLIRLSQAADKIGHGDMSVRVDVRSKDEIGGLAVSFNKMTRDLKHFNEELINAKAKLGIV